MKAIVLHAAAKRELQEALDYLDCQYEGLGSEFMEEFHSVATKMGAMPQMFPPFPGVEGVHKAVFKRFSYLLPFMEWQGEIWVLAVAHQRRRPAYWAKRKPAAAKKSVSRKRSAH